MSDSNLFSMTPAGSWDSLVETAFCAPVASLNFCANISTSVHSVYFCMSVERPVCTTGMQAVNATEPRTLVTVPTVAVTVFLRKPLSSTALTLDTDDVWKWKPKLRSAKTLALLPPEIRRRACMMSTTSVDVTADAAVEAITGHAVLQIVLRCSFR